MTKSMKKPTFLLPVARLFTQPHGDAYDEILFRSSESFGDESSPALSAPDDWSNEAVAVMATAACDKIPPGLRIVEENTVPSWLWRKRAPEKKAETKSGAKHAVTQAADSREAEGDIRLIVDRVVGSAAARGWQMNLFSSERHARCFFDELRFAFIRRHIAVMPDILAGWGLDWAYGLDAAPATQMAEHNDMTPLSNAAIDAVTGTSAGTKAPVWKKLFQASTQNEKSIALRLSDIAADWQSDEPNPARAAIDLMALRDPDGSVNLDALRQASRLLSILLDLQDCGSVTIGLANLAPLLLALGLGYDSDAGRAMAASLAALVTAECYGASAEMAALRGPSDAFLDAHEGVMRSLRNHRRAVHGDDNDYEKLSVLPAPLPLKHCPDLALAAEAQRLWDETVDDVKAYGLRAIEATDLTPSPMLKLLMQSMTQGLEPLASLTQLRQDENDMFVETAHPALAESLARLGYPRATARDVLNHVVGTHSLRRAHGVHHASLAAAGLDAHAIEKIEAYIPCVTDIRFAVTPWVVGVDYCRTRLKLTPRQLQSPRFDLLKYLGFTDELIFAANKHCYGHGSVRAAKAVQLRHRVLFAIGNEVGAEARIRMAASVQSFISGDTGIVIRMPARESVERGAEMTLLAWRHGLKSLNVMFDPALTPRPARAAAGANAGTVPRAARRIKAATHAHAETPKMARQGRSAKSVASGKAAGKSLRDSDKRARRH
jgi:hypothetical protein